MNLLKVFTWDEVEVFERVSESIKEEASLINYNEYAFWDRKSPILLQAHIDVVSNGGKSTKWSKGKWDYQTQTFISDEKEKEEEKDEKGKIEVLKYRNVIISKKGILGGDDRAGIMAIISINNTCMENKYPLPSILLTNGEERGGKGMETFIKDISSEDADKKLFDPVRIIIALDRRGVSEYVYYIEPAIEARRYIESFGFIKGFGTYSDSKELSAKFKIPSVNLSVGYYDNHSVRETVHIDEVFLTAKRVCNMINDPIDKRYEVAGGKAYSVSYNNDWDFCGCPGNYMNRNREISPKVLSPEIEKKILTETEKRRKRCANMQKANNFPISCIYYPYLDYLLTDQAIIGGFHVVSSKELGGKSLEEWSYIFNSIEGDRTIQSWKTTFGGQEKIYVRCDQDPHRFYLAIKIEGRTAYSATVCEVEEARIMKEEAAKIISEVQREKEQESGNSIGTEDFVSMHGYCEKYNEGECSGGCHGNRYYCDCPNGASNTWIPMLPGMF